MFTGRVETVGKIRAIRHQNSGIRILVEASALVSHLKQGSSVAVDGVCLTVEALKKESFEVFAAAETLSCANLADLRVGEGVNLERAVACGSPMDGHLLTGHVDGVGTVVNLELEGSAYLYTIAFPPQFLRYLAVKGSVAIDGVSLTVVELNEQNFKVSLIPYTLGNTTLGKKGVGAKVNLEFDILSKYVEQHLKHLTHSGSDFLLEELVAELPDQNFLLN